jgi:hypothetical protein
MINDSDLHRKTKVFLLKKIGNKWGHEEQDKNIEVFSSISRVHAMLRSKSITTHLCPMYYLEPVYDKTSKRCNTIVIIAIMAKSLGGENTSEYKSAK